MSSARHAARLTAQGLSGPPATSVDAVVTRLLAVQAQDLQGARLAVRARSAGLTSSDVDAALADGRLVVDWLCRGTLHLVRREDHAELHALTTPQLARTSERRLRQEGVDATQAARGVEVVRETVGAGPATRDELRTRLDEAGVPVARQGFVHVLMAASLQGVCVRGPVVDGAQAFVDRETWLGPQPPLDRDAALGRLAVRYLTGHGPATAADLARWAGTSLGDARRAVQLAGDAVVVDEDGTADLVDREPPRPLPPPRLLGPFEPLLLGWTSRADVIGPHVRLVTDNGLFRAFVLVDGRAVATWSAARRRVTVTPLEPCDADLDDEVADVERFLSS